MPSKRVIVIGAGIIGTCIASYLQRAGHDVMLVERAGVGAGCSAGNAGLLSISGCVPLGRLSTIIRLPQYLLDRKGPVSIDLGHLPHSLPWFRCLVQASTPAAVGRIAGVLAALLRESQPALFELVERIGCPGLVRRSGTLYVFETRKAFSKAQEGFRLRRRFGIELEEMSGPELRRLEPALAPIFEYAVRVPGNAYCNDPFQLVQAIFVDFRRHQGCLVTGDVRHIEGSGASAKVHLADGRRLEADSLVVAAGAWTKDLLRPLGTRLLLEPHRGYHISTTDSRIALTHPLLWEERGIGITPMAAGLRGAGTVEIAALSAPPNPYRAEEIRRLMRRIFPDLETAKATTWMGSRPTTPDSLPVIGAVASHPNIYAATGHGHLGLSMAAVTGRIVGDLVSGVQPAFDLLPLRPDRF